jgi:molybdopterin-guanine dinucleotide biosynthesis protein A
MSNLINGLVLAGGKSVRMGSDKGLINYHGKPQREYVFELLQPFCNHVYTSCKGSSGLPAHLNPLYDAFDLQGPFNGILSAFRYDPGSAWLVMAVDMPYVDQQTLSVLVVHRDPTRMATCFWNSSTQSPEPLLTIWEAHAWVHLLAYHKSGGTSPREFLAQHNVTMVEPRDPRWLVSVNTLPELRQIQNLHQ